ncbi:hypothetical protein NL108_018094 [Boleophthalmus pectinirostris]|uniref:uncharacterized protein LOC110173660 n=1 Tax=Boleophthalmus pectinirostris TaxID=150288 RepID=UPI00242DD73A|nr:uncharacterized protein LOC110173660 [Boleophthalmus pectinirostris]KAJ0061391.1 hypothetical protein NL108_018094 [Boleophthalmus pectinirostris]
MEVQTEVKMEVKMEVQMRRWRWRWSVVTLLTFMFLLDSGGASHSVVSKFDGEAQLPCSGMKNFNCCDISWRFQGLKASAPVNMSLSKKKNVIPRFSLMKNCGLQFYAVMDKDVGWYFCHGPGPDSKLLHKVSLSLVKAQQVGGAGTWSCFLSSPELHRFSVTSEMMRDYKKNQWIKNLGQRKLKCTVVDLHTKKKKELHLQLPDSFGFKYFLCGVVQTCNKTQNNSTSSKTSASLKTSNTTRPEARPEARTRPLIRVKVLSGLIAGLGVALVSLLFVIILLCKCKANQTQRDKRNEEELHYTTVMFQTGPDQTGATRSDPVTDEDFYSTVIYSDVTCSTSTCAPPAPPASPAPPAPDPTALYATVNKPRPNQNQD